MDTAGIMEQGDKDRLHSIFKNTNAKITYTHPHMVRLEVGNMAYYFRLYNSNGFQEELIYDGWEWTAPLKPVPEKM